VTSTRFWASDESETRINFTKCIDKKHVSGWRNPVGFLLYLVIQCIQPIIEQFIHSDAKVSGNNWQKRDVRYGQMIFPLADRLG